MEIVILLAGGDKSTQSKDIKTALELARQFPPDNLPRLTVCYTVGERKVRYVTSVERLAIERGMQKGMQQGLEKGIVKGEGTILRRQLTRRFGPLPQDILDRLAAADAAQLETWADRVIDATSLDEVFAGG